MWIHEFTHEIKSNEEPLLEVLGAFLTGKANIELQIINENKIHWKFNLPDNIDQLPPQIALLGKKSDTLNISNTKYWIVRPLILDDRAVKISGGAISNINQFPLEELLKNSERFQLEIFISRNQSVPLCRIETLVGIEIRTDNSVIAETIAQILNGRVYEDEKSTFAYVSELKYFLRPPISTHNYNSDGVFSKESSIQSVFLNENTQLTKHCLICGQTGSGKTNTAKLIMDQVKQSAPYCNIMILDNKGEYRDWALKNQIPFLDVGNHPESLGILEINPFIPGKNVKLQNHLETLANILSVSGFTGSGIILPEYMKIILYQFFINLWGLNENQFFNLLNFTGERLIALHYPFKKSINGRIETIPRLFYQFWNEFKIKKFEKIFGVSRTIADLQSVLSARIYALTNGPLNFFSYGENAKSPDHILDDSFVLSFNGASNNNLILLTSLLTFLFCDSASSRNETTLLRNALLIEEAHLILKRPIKTAEVETAENLLGEVFERMLAILRSRGVGMIIVDQSPSRLVQNVIANTGSKIVHQLTQPFDIKEISESIGLPETNELMFLPVGHCYQKIGSSQPQKEIMNLWKARDY